MHSMWSRISSLAFSFSFFVTFFFRPSDQSDASSGAAYSPGAATRGGSFSATLSFSSMAL